MPSDANNATRDLHTDMAFDLSTIAKRKAEHNHPAYTKMAALMGIGAQIKGEGSYVEEHTGRKVLTFFDQYGNQSMGYSHPVLVKALIDKLMSDNVNSTKIFFEEEMTLLAESLSRLTDHQLKFCYFANSGGETIDNALKLARATNGRRKFITTVGCFHGKTWAALSAASRPDHVDAFGPLMDNFCLVPFGDIKAMEQAIDTDTCAVLLEPIQAENGVILPPSGYLERLRALCDQYDVALIFDEMQLAFGRTGKFFGFQNFNVIPDIFCIGKAFGGGIVPISAVIAKEKYWGILSTNPTTFGSSLGGNPVSITAGLTMVNITNNSSHLNGVLEKGQVVRQRLDKLAIQYPSVIKEVRGIGLMYGIELVNISVAGLILSILYDKGLTSTYSLYNPKVIRVQPPMNISMADIHKGLDILETGFEELVRYLGTQNELSTDNLKVIDIDVDIPLHKLGAFLQSYPSFLDPFAHDRWDGQVTNAEFQGTLGVDRIIWENEIVVSPDKVVSKLTSSWLFNNLERKISLSPKGDGATITFEAQWDCGIYAYEKFMQNRIAYYITNRFSALIDSLQAELMQPLSV